MKTSMSDPQVWHDFWQAFLDQLARGESPPADRYPDWYFGDNPALADELGELVLAGVKTATCTLLLEFQRAAEPLPQVGERSIITRYNGQPLGIIETTSVEVLPFEQVSAEFAFAEGEGDRSYASWRAGHVRYFTRRCQELGEAFDPGMAVVCERFRLLFPR